MHAPAGEPMPAEQVWVLALMPGQTGRFLCGAGHYVTLSVPRYASSPLARIIAALSPFSLSIRVN